MHEACTPQDRLVPKTNLERFSGVWVRGRADRHIRVLISLSRTRAVLAHQQGTNYQRRVAVELNCGSRHSTKYPLSKFRNKSSRIRTPHNDSIASRGNRVLATTMALALVTYQCRGHARSFERELAAFGKTQLIRIEHSSERRRIVI